MEATVATLLLVTASVVLACVVVGYAVNIAQATMTSPDFAQNIESLDNYVNTLLNQTNNALDGSIGSTPTPQDP